MCSFSGVTCANGNVTALCAGSAKARPACLCRVRLRIDGSLGARCCAGRCMTGR
jgi:hypothetical protein